MNIRNALLINFFVFVCIVKSQNFSGVYKINDLLKRIDSPDTIYVVNFWATWCKPCIQELPAFDSLFAITGKTNIKILLVSLDFKEELDNKVKPFLIKHEIKSECVLLDETNGNDFINKISPQWSGTIPATLFKQGDKKKLVEKKMNLLELQAVIHSLEK
jgi:thiol-disulfide isomerase/thioredoxin